jgi:DNA-binding NarL/FixJ family response regulator
MDPYASLAQSVEFVKQMVAKQPALVEQFVQQPPEDALAARLRMASLVPNSVQLHNRKRNARMNVITVVLADTPSVVRAGLKALIDAQPDMAVIGEASDAVDALRYLATHHPQVVVLDLSMPCRPGLEALQRLFAAVPRPRVLMLSAHEDASYLQQALKAGAMGYVLKRSAAESLIEAIRVVSAGGTYLDPALGTALAQHLGNGSRAVGAIAPLSEREDVVLRLIAQGYSNKEIAARLDLSVKTVETYKARAMEKLRLSGRVDIVRYASAQGWLS